MNVRVPMYFVLRYARLCHNWLRRIVRDIWLVNPLVTEDNIGVIQGLPPRSMYSTRDGKIARTVAVRGGTVSAREGQSKNL